MRGTLHLGELHPDLERAFAERLRALAPDGDARAVRLVVPNRLLGLHLRRRAAELGAGTLGLRPQALEDLVAELAAPALAARGWRPAPGWAMGLVVEELIGKRARRGYFKQVAELAGTYTALAATLRDLRDGDVAPADFAAAVRPYGKRGRLADLAELLALADAGLAERRLADLARQTDLAIERLREEPPRGALLLYGVYDLLPRQRRFVEALAGESAVDVFFPWGEGRAFAYAAPLRAWFEGRGLTPVPAAAAPPPGPTRLAALRRDLFADAPAGGSAADDSVRLVSAPHPEREALVVLRTLATAPASSALVLLRREGDTVGRLRGAARRAGVELHVAAEPLAVRPAGRAARLLAELVDQGGRRPAADARPAIVARTAVEDLLAGGALDRSLFEDGSRPGRWAQILRRRGIVGRRGDWETFVARYAGEGAQGTLPFAEGAEEDRFLDPRLRRERPALARFVARLLAELDRLAPLLRGGAGAWSRAATALAETCERWLAPGADREAVVRAARALAELDGALRLTPRRAAAALAHALEAPGPDSGPRFGAAATLATLAAARGVTADRVVVPALVEGTFPRRAREDPMLLDAERRAIQATLPPGSALPLLGAATLAEERLLFRLACGAARRQLVLTWTRALDGGREVVPSTFVLEAARALLGRDVDVRMVYRAAGALDLEVVPLAPTYPLAGDDLFATEGDLRAIDRVRAGAAPAGALARLFDGRPRFRDALRADLARRAETLGAYDGVVGGGLGAAYLAALSRPAGAGLPAAVRLSASRLQSYARCGFRYFLDNALGARSEPAPERFLDLGAGELGTLYHEVLHEVFRRLQAESALPLSPRTLPRAEAALAEVLAHEHLFEDEAPEPLRRARRHRMREDLGGFLAAQAEEGGGWTPRAFEVDLGGEPPLVVEVGRRRLVLAGRVDRVDTGAAGLRIVDYKTGKLAKDGYPEPPALAGGRNLQLAYYARALAAQRARDGEPPAEIHAAYLGVTAGSGFRQVAWEPRHFARAEAELQRVVEGVVGGVERGEFFQVENQTFCTQQCEFTLLCGPGRARTIARKAGDARAVHAAEWRSGAAFPDAGGGEEGE